MTSIIYFKSLINFRQSRTKKYFVGFKDYYNQKTKNRMLLWT